jgi:hypothetical protein
MYFLARGVLARLGSASRRRRSTRMFSPMLASSSRRSGSKRVIVLAVVKLSFH